LSKTVISSDQSSTEPPDQSIENVWLPEDAQHLYLVPAWGSSYFFVNEKGHVAVKPIYQSDIAIDLYTLIQELQQENVQFPVLVRFMDLLQTRVMELNEAFRAAIIEAGYKNKYMGVYPIKVNQMHEVVEEIFEAGQPYQFGLECGSKAELIATLPYLADDNTLLVCNGYKDPSMVNLMMTFQKLGKNIIPIVEKFSEFKLIMKTAKDMNHVPRFGVRVRLSASTSGQWASTSGDSSKFGVSISELLDIIETLKSEDQVEALKLVHFHMGSQISEIKHLKAAIKETARIYAKLYQQGMTHVEYVDVGGGLGVNYEAGSIGNGINYGFEEYVNCVVYGIMEVCDVENVPHPIIVSESGRAITAHHSVLITEVLGHTARPHLNPDFELYDNDHASLKELYSIWENLRQTPNLKLNQLLEIYHDTAELRQQTDTLFSFGYLDLEQKAQTERLYWSICKEINERVHATKSEWLPQELDDLVDHLVDQYLCDFSLFQSMMDHWSIDQKFPIMPIHRLDEEPKRRATLVDLTCDSDGKISDFICPDYDKHFLEVHELKKDEPYYLGFFLMGAYQDILGDRHNLFGRVNEVHVYADAEESNNIFIENNFQGANIEEMLAQVQYFPNQVQKRMHALLLEKVRQGKLRPKASKELLDLYSSFFKEYTYFRTK
jgi:arginine decarboxylase